MAIVVTGAAGFIGSCLVSFLNQKGIEDLILVDDFSIEKKKDNWVTKKYRQLVNRKNFLSIRSDEVDFVFHLGARTDTTEMDQDVFDELNFNYSKMIWKWCVDNNIALIYASSAATYGSGEQGFSDAHQEINALKALNPYGQSKLDFDRWVLSQNTQPPFWCGLKFFNVFGPNEYHKGRMASVVFHAFNQINETEKLKLFQSHKSEYRDGEQKRDFIYVKDLLDLMWFWYEHRAHSGIYNAGTGTARTFLDLANAIFKAMNLVPNIEFIPTPMDIRESYQYFTEAEMRKTRDTGYKMAFTELENAVEDYVTHYLTPNTYY